MADIIGNIIATGARRVAGLGEALASGVGPGIFARLPVIDGRTIVCNHPAFVYGHLSLYPHRVMSLCGLDAGAVAPPDAWRDLFTAGAECRDDPDGSIYPAAGELVPACIGWTRAAIEAVAALPDARFAEPNPAGGKYTEVFPTLGVMASFMLNNHPAMHYGQVSTFRRIHGLGPVM